ncbi:MAG: AmmeMemoRadiSam system protein B [Xanthomonadales bacterium]|nr:AmmeMemoRadiSam system protein B [Xanthomonadales bacterium]
MSSSIREPAVAGFFYPDDPAVLERTLDRYLDPAPETLPHPPRALVVPHAGYIYSGEVAAKAFRLLSGHEARFRRVVLVGPAHRMPVRGMALPESAAFATPLGEVSLDRPLVDELAAWPGVVRSDAVHAHEHSLEVQLPFLQRLLPDARLVPVAVGDATAEQVEQLLDHCLDDHTLLIISTDLSHYLSYHEARRTDQDTLERIAEGDWRLHGEQACGCRGVNGLLRLADRRSWTSRLLEYRNSGDTAGSKDRVVGYAALVFEDA